jgi:hypothetical protein
MRFHTERHQFCCAIDLRARQMHDCVFDEAGRIVLSCNLPAGPKQLARAIEPYVGHDMVTAVERVFTLPPGATTRSWSRGTAKRCRSSPGS